MQRSVAVAKLGQMLGKSLGYRIDDKAPTKDERAAAREALKLAVAERDRLQAQKRERCDTILAADHEYQELKQAYAAANKKVEMLGSITRRVRLTVGVSTGIFFHVKAEGDSWEEIIEKLQAQKKKAAA